MPGFGGRSIITASGGGAGSGLAVLERVVLFDRLLTSGTWSKASAAANLAVNGVADPAPVEVEIIVVSGGAGGRNGTSAPGGHPGLVNSVKMRFGDMPESCPYVIGSGGPGNGDGGLTSFGALGTTGSIVYANGAVSAVSAGLQSAYVFGAGRTEAWYPNLTDYADSTSRPNSASGPGGGGMNATSRYVGGIGSGRLSTDSSRPAYDATETAEDGRLWLVRSFGAGGAGNPSGSGTNGGRPGGGGGGGSSKGGSGGAGLIWVVYRVWEVLA